MHLSPRQYNATTTVGTAAELAAVNPVLPEGQTGWDSTNGVSKVGDGLTAWADLPVALSGTYAPLLNTPSHSDSASVMLVDDATSGQTAIGTDFMVYGPTGTTVYSRKTATPNILQTSTNGSTLVDKYTFTGDGYINGILVLPTGTVIVATSSVSGLTKSTYIHLWRSTNGGTSFTQVDGGVLAASGQVPNFGMAATASVAMVGTYGYKGADSDAHYVYRSTDDGVTWAQALDIGANSNRHVHAVYADTDGNFWVTTGDDNTSGAGNVGGRNVWSSDDDGANWTANVFLDPVDGRLQLLDVADYRGYLYMAQDNSLTGGRIFRCRKSDPTNTLETVYDPNPDLLASLATAPPMYSLGVDTTNNVIYAFAPGELAGQRGQILASGNGVDWVTLFQTPIGSVSPLASRFSSNATSSFIMYSNYRIKKKLPRRVIGQAGAQQQTLVFNWPGTISTQAEKFALAAASLGYDFRVVSVSAFARVAGAGGAISIQAKNGGTNICSTDPTIADGAATTARYAVGVITKTALTQRFSTALASLLTIDVTAGSGGSDLTVTVVVEKQQGPLITP